jgi:hypothetical protein
LQKCYGADGTPFAVGCDCFDADTDGDVDDADVTALQSQWTGPDAGIPGCTVP